MLTNYHVWKHGLADLSQAEFDRLGTEFEARDGRSESEFSAFADAPPIILPKMDVVVLTLLRTARRTPIWPVDRRVENEAVILIGYPAAPRRPIIGFEKMKIEEIYGAPPLWDIKRWSEGRVICLRAHASAERGVAPASADDHAEDGFFHLADMHQRRNEAKRPVLCHSASSVDGNSGGALISAETGEFIGLHCGGAYAAGRDVNFAVPARDLLSALAEHLPPYKNALREGGHI